MDFGVRDIRQRTWDFWLTIATVGVLAGLGVQSFLGTLYSWWAHAHNAGWDQSAGYTHFVGVMNVIAAPLIVALVVLMGLCVPKRLFDRLALVWVSAGMVAVAVAAGVWTRSLVRGLTVYLLLACVIQVAVVVLTAAGTRGPSYLTEGRLTKLGSGLLHLGFLVFAIVVVALQQSSLMLPVFFVSFLLAAIGMALSFYADSLAWRRSRRIPAEQPIEL